MPVLYKIRAIAVAALVAALAAIGQTIASVEWTDFGVWGVPVGVALSAVIGYMKRDPWIRSLIERASGVPITSTPVEPDVMA